MFSETLTSWDLGLEPSGNSAFFSEKQESDALFFTDVVGGAPSASAPALVQDLPDLSSAPLELDIFEQELRRQEQEQLEAAKDSNIVPAAATAASQETAAFMVADPKMITSPDNNTINTSVFDDSGIDLNLTQEGTQNLIDEMESFLRQHEQQQETTDVQMDKEEEASVDFVVAEVPEPASAAASSLDLLKQVMEEVQMDVEEVKAEPELSDEDNSQAEAILDALIKGDLTSDFNPATTAIADIEEIVEETPTTITKREPEAAPKPIQPIFNGINNISEVITADGQKIVIVIANDMPNGKQEEAAAAVRPATKTPQFLPQVASEPSEGEEEGDSSDSEWTPSFAAPARKTAASTSKKAASSKPAPKPKAVSVGRVAKQRGPYSKRAHASVKDKKERKKLQNVEAARRYRDKKKAEQSVVETEEEQLAAKNSQLKSQLGEVENELKTLKKLMTDLGLVK